LPNFVLGDDAMAFSTNGISASSGLSSEINITPLIDVLLVMLIIFMVIVPIMPRGLGASLPLVDRGNTFDKNIDGPVLVQIERRSSSVHYVIDGASVERAEIGSRLVSALSQRPARRMLLKADADLDFGVIAGVIDAGQAAGTDGIGLMTPGLLALAR
jgi:biopolymer transport protein TolR